MFDQVYESERIALFIGPKKITTNMKSHIIDAKHSGKLRDYYIEKHDWQPQVWDTIDWAGFHSATRHSSHSRDVFRATNAFRSSSIPLAPSGSLMKSCLNVGIASRDVLPRQSGLIGRSRQPST